MVRAGSAPPDSTKDSTTVNWGVTSTPWKTRNNTAKTCTTKNYDAQRGTHTCSTTTHQKRRVLMVYFANEQWSPPNARVEVRVDRSVDDMTERQRAAWDHLITASAEFLTAFGF